jgi:spore maturation protein CgeB
MNVVYFTHSLRSCWNHGNAHFLRGVLREIARRGHVVRAMEPSGSWSMANLLAEHGERGLSIFHERYPDLQPSTYSDIEQALLACDGADLVIVHEWNDPALVAALGRARKLGERFVLLFHDTHHRAVSDPAAVRAFDLSGYDGILAFGEALAAVYRRWGWGSRAFVWHEAADTTLFHPPETEGEREGLVWIGNWGDGERTKELEAYLLAPAAAARLDLDIHGVRYPDDALTTLERYGARYRGWLANPLVPDVFASHIATVHVPRRFYTRRLPGIPTIRVFEALACGIPLLSAPWEDAEGLFRGGQDFLMVESSGAAAIQLRALRDDRDLRASLSAAGLETIRTRHTCAHRADQLLAITRRLDAPLAAETGPAA